MLGDARSSSLRSTTPLGQARRRDVDGGDRKKERGAQAFSFPDEITAVSTRDVEVQESLLGIRTESKPYNVFN